MILNHVKGWWTAHVTGITTLCYFLVPSVQNFINTHPKSTIGAILAVVISALFTRPPLQKVG